jgi:hypothetical protein
VGVAGGGVDDTFAEAVCGRFTDRVDDFFPRFGVECRDERVSLLERRFLDVPDFRKVASCVHMILPFCPWAFVGSTVTIA